MELRILLLLAVCFLKHDLCAQFSGIGEVIPTHTLHIKPLGVADPLRVQGLNAGAATDSHVLAVDPSTGVVKAIPRSTFTDNQALSFDASTSQLTLARGGAPINLSGLGDDLGDHTADVNLNMNTRDADFTSGNLNMATGAANFGTALRQMINLNNSAYGIGAQTLTAYNRSARNFAWYRGGSHSNTALNPGTGGTVAMVLDNNSKLTVSGELEFFNFLHGSGKQVIRTSDDYLRLNNQKDFTLGVYTPGNLRVDEAVTFNEDGGDFNFRAEGDTDPNLLLLDASTDRVGIGTLTPDSKLEVAGRTTTENFTMSAGAANNFILQSNATGVASWVDPSSIASGNIYSTDGTLAANRVVTQGNFDLNFDANTLVISGNDDRVGIGTNAPSNKLNVRAEEPQLDLSDNAGTRLQLGYSETNTLLSNVLPAQVIVNTGGDLQYSSRTNTPSAHRFYTPAAGVPVQRVTIADNGNVGIGTPNPIDLLHIDAGDAGDAVLIIEADRDGSDDGDTPKLIFRQDNGANVSALGHGLVGGVNENILQISNSMGAGGIQFLTGVSGAGYTTADARMLITGVGNVGINTMNPSSRLDVAGDARIRVLGAGAAADDIVTVDGAGNLRRSSKSLAGDNLGNHTATQDLTMSGHEINFGATAGQHINLYNNTYGIGIQNNTQYYRSANNFAWFRGGSHNVGTYNPGGGGTALMVLEANGRLGVGTTAPDAQLTIREAVPTASERSLVELYSTGGGVNQGSSISFRNGGAGYMASIAGLDDGSNDGRLEFRTSGNGGFSPNTLTTADTRMMISRLGRVGIGTTAPSSQLTVRDDNNNVNINGNVQKDVAELIFRTSNFSNEGANFSQAMGGLGLYASFDSNNDRRKLGGVYGQIGSNNSGHLIFTTMQVNVERERMTITELGRVGIGTSSPSRQFEVSQPGDSNPFVSAASPNLIKIASTDNNSSTGVILEAKASTGVVQSYAFGINPNFSGGLLTMTNALGQDFFGYINSTQNVYTNATGGNLGVGTRTPTEKLHVIGNIFATGNINSSDSTLKTNIVPSDYGLAEVLQLQPVLYNWKQAVQEKGGYDSRRQVGFLAQAVEILIPEAVTGEEGNGMGIDYAKLTSVLVGAMQEQQGQINELKATNAQLVSDLAKLKEEFAEMKEARESVH